MTGTVTRFTNPVVKIPYVTPPQVKLTMNHIQVVLGERQRARAEFVTEDIKKREAENLEKRRLEENAAQNTAATPPSA